MEWRQDGNRLVVKNRYETLWLEPWGTDALRVRATQNPRMSGAAGALNPAPPARRRSARWTTAWRSAAGGSGPR